MTACPAYQTTTSNDAELPENMAMLTVSSRNWNGVNVDLNEFTCTGRVLFPMDSHGESTRLGTLLEEVGRDHAETRSAANKPNPIAYKPRHMYFAPAGHELWGHSSDTLYVKCAAISFDVAMLQDRLGICESLGPVDTPHLRLFDDRLWTLVKLLTDSISETDPTAQLYGDSLTAAIAARLFERPKESKGSESGLSAIQLKDALGYLESKMPEKVELETLAKLAGLSQSHFSRAFKASTGLAPYQWQLQSRIETARNLLLNTNDGLEDIALATGFADAVHFGRTFRKLTGATPAAWRMDRLT